MTVETIHATSLEIDGHAVLIMGPPGSGKSDLALRLIDRGATLIADDRTILRLENGRPIASCPPSIIGHLEIRGLGIATVPCSESAPVALVVQMVSRVERLPKPTRCSIASVMVRSIEADPREASAPIKVELALRQPEAMIG